MRLTVKRINGSNYLRFQMFLCILILEKFALKVVLKAKRPGDIPSEYRPTSLIFDPYFDPYHDRTGQNPLTHDEMIAIMKSCICKGQRHLLALGDTV